MTLATRKGMGTAHQSPPRRQRHPPTMDATSQQGPRPVPTDPMTRVGHRPPASVRRGQAGQVGDQPEKHAQESMRACIIMYYYVRETANECVGCILAHCPDGLLGTARLYPTNVQTMSNAEFPLRLTLCSNAGCSSSYV